VPAGEAALGELPGGDVEDVLTRAIGVAAALRNCGLGHVPHRRGVAGPDPGM